MAHVLDREPIRPQEFTVRVSESMRVDQEAVHALHTKNVNPFTHGVVVGKYGEDWRKRANAKPSTITRSKYKDPYD